MVPRGKELPLKQELYDQWGNLPSFKDRWAELVANHDARYNLSGVPARSNTRPREEESLASERQAVPLTSASGTPSTWEELVLKYPGDDVLLSVEHSPGLNIVVAPNKTLYLHNTSNSPVVLSTSEPLFYIKGSFLLGQAATAHMRDGNNWVDWNVTGAPPVCMKFQGTPALQLPEGPLPLQSYLTELERAGHVRVKVFQHSCSRVPDAPGTYNVACTTAACIPQAPGAPGAVPGLTNLSSFTSISQIKLSSVVHIVHHCHYKMLPDKEVSCHHPGVLLRAGAQGAGARVSAGQVIQIVPPPAA